MIAGTMVLRTDCRSFVGFAQMMGLEANNIIVGGNSSLNMMFDTISCAMTHGFTDCKPWGRQNCVKFLCPAPGYDRHLPFLSILVWN